jgi:hypothetical protein
LAVNNVTSFSGLTLVPTFHCMSVYASYAGDDNTNSVCAVRYRVTGSGNTWLNGLNLWTDINTRTYKGSLVYLTPNTSYDVAVDLTDTDGTPATTSITNTVSTWSETPQVAVVGGFTTSITGSPNFTISTYGTGVSAMRQYGPSSGRVFYVVSSQNDARAVIINADNILLQNIDFIGGTQNVVKVIGGRTNIWIKNCTFSNWGYPATVLSDSSGQPDQYDNAAVTFGDNNTAGSYRCVIESCTVNPPTGSSRSWAVAGQHPGGPHGIFAANMSGQNVCRYNWVHGSGLNDGTGHWYNDAIGGFQNESSTGEWGKDSDVYGNVVSEANDDAMEIDGGNQNIRVFGNSITNMHTAISTAANSVGPSYIFRNSGQWWSDPGGGSYGGVGVKRGISSGAPNIGREYLFNNTFDSRDGKKQAANGSDESGGNSVNYNTVFNGIWNTVGTCLKDTGTFNTYDYDLFNPGNSTLPAGSESHGINSTATYLSGGFLATSSQGYHVGLAVNNFLMDASGAPISNPNMGAFDERFFPIPLGPQTGAPVCDPCIQVQPQSLTVNCGTIATFTVTATGNSPLTYQWIKNGVGIGGATSSSYSTPATSGSDNNAVFTCQVADTGGSTTTSGATLTVSLIASQPQDLTVSVGQGASFTVVGTSCATTYQWSRNGSAIANATTTTYTLINPQAGDNGVLFSCALTTSGTPSQTTRSALLTVTGGGYYVDPVNGNDANSGTSQTAAWKTAAHACSTAGVSNTIILMDGLYPASDPLAIPQPWQTIKSLNRWGAKFYNRSTYTFIVPDGASATGNGITFDGIACSNCQYYPVFVRPYGASNVTVRNCWITQTGKTWPVSEGASGVQVYPGLNVLYERNLLEWNGTNNTSFNHGIYGGGTNGIYRFNVCRYNGGLGINVDGHIPTGDKNNSIYGNLCYGNWGGGSQHDQIEVYNDQAVTPSSGLWTNYVYNNTMYSSDFSGNAGTAGIWCQDGSIYLTNNLIISTGGGIMRFSSFTADKIWGDYDLGPQAFAFGAGPHDVVSGGNNFANRINGLYWLVLTAPARSAALAGVHGPTDFFGSPISSVSDIGAFQYNAAYAADTRVLDPSTPGVGANYWLLLSTDPNIVTQPSSLTVFRGATASFTVVASGNSTLSYQWNKAPSTQISGATSATYVTPSTFMTDNQSQYFCTVTDGSGQVNSANAVLTVEGISTQPQDQTAVAGQSVLFTVVAAGPAPFTYQWYKNGNQILGANQSTYQTPNLLVGDNGSAYYVIVGFSEGIQEQSRTAGLTVFANPPNGGSGKGGRQGRGGRGGTH